MADILICNLGGNADTFRPIVSWDGGFFIIYFKSHYIIYSIVEQISIGGVIMLDIKFLRENPEIVKQNIRNKFQDNKLALVDEVIALDVESRATKQEADNLRSERNRISKQIGGLMAQGKREEAEELKKNVTAQSDRLSALEAKENELQEKSVPS